MMSEDLDWRHSEKRGIIVSEEVFSIHEWKSDSRGTPELCVIKLWVSTEVVPREVSFSVDKGDQVSHPNYYPGLGP